MIKGKDAITKEAMETLRYLYQDGNPAAGYHGPEDPVRKELLGKMAKEATDIFLEGRGTYASAIFEVANDYAEGVEGGMIPGLCHKEDLAKFYDKHSVAVVRKAEAVCNENFYFDDIPGVADDRWVSKDSTKAALVKFVVDNEVNFIRKELQWQRDNLEKITREKERPAASLRPRRKSLPVRANSKEDERVI